MSYKDALEAAGAIVSDFQDFGDYQGTWYAVVHYEGKSGIVEGSYGSCDGCDAFQGEFGYLSPQEETKEQYNFRLKEFGKAYLVDIQDINSVFERELKNKSYDWDLEAKEKLSWLKQLHNLAFKDKLEKLVEEE